MTAMIKPIAIKMIGKTYDFFLYALIKMRTKEIARMMSPIIKPINSILLPPPKQINDKFLFLS